MEVISNYFPKKKNTINMKKDNAIHSICMKKFKPYVYPQAVNK